MASCSMISLTHTLPVFVILWMGVVGIHLKFNEFGPGKSLRLYHVLFFSLISLKMTVEIQFRIFSTCGVLHVISMKSYEFIVGVKGTPWALSARKFGYRAHHFALSHLLLQINLCTERDSGPSWPVILLLKEVKCYTVARNFSAILWLILLFGCVSVHWAIMRHFACCKNRRIYDVSIFLILLTEQRK
jgi:hypothetical protein